MTVHNTLCASCGAEYDMLARKGKHGRIIDCDDCADEQGDEIKYTGVLIYGHKTSAEIQINKDPRLTEYLINATKLKNKGSNMTNNIANCTKYKNLNKTEDACLKVADTPDYKNRSGM